MEKLQTNIYVPILYPLLQGHTRTASASEKTVLSLGQAILM